MDTITPALTSNRSRIDQLTNSLDINKCKKLKQFRTRCKDDMVNSDN